MHVELWHGGRHTRAVVILDDGRPAEQHACHAGLTVRRQRVEPDGSLDDRDWAALAQRSERGWTPEQARLMAYAVALSAAHYMAETWDADFLAMTAAEVTEALKLLAEGGQT